MEIKKAELSKGKDQVLSYIVRSLEAGRIPWWKNWKGRAQYASNYSSKYKFQGINNLIAGCSAFDTPYFLTQRQIEQLGGKLKKDAKALPMVFWQKKERALNMKLYRVYNLEEVLGIKFDFEKTVKRKADLTAAEQLLAQMPRRPSIDISLRDTACYNVLLDTVYMPGIGRIKSVVNYYQLLIPRLIQASGHASRLGREGLIAKIRLGKSSFSSEDLIADIGAGILYRKLGLGFPKLRDKNMYIRGWINELNANRQRIFMAARAARAAVTYIEGKMA
ncbi:MAG: zincin-like metallopeptidase domain-containing protein [Bacteroidota bacterium]